MIRPVSELKLQMLNDQNELPPVAIDFPGGNPDGVYELNHVFGPGITQWDRYVPLEGFVWPQGTNQSQRVGKYMYLRNTMLKLQFQANDQSGPVVSPIRIRCVIFKARRSHTPSGVIKDPSQSLFLNGIGNEFGTKNVGLKVMDWNTSLTNKRNFMIVKDCSFIIQPTVVQPQGQDFIGQSTRYPSQKNIAISLGHFQKAAFENANNRPTDANYQYGITCIATSMNSTQANAWNLSIRGTTSCYDN